MDNLQAVKDFLTSYRDIKRRIVQIEAEIELTRLDKMAPSAQLISDMPKAHNTYDLSDYAAKCDALLSDLRSQYDAAIERKRLVIKVIETETDSEAERLLLWYRYIDLEPDGRLMRYEAIAVKTAYSYGSVRYILRQAHAHLAENWEKICKKYRNTLPME